MGPGDETDDGRWWHARAAMTGSVPFRLIERGWVAVGGAPEATGTPGRTAAATPERTASATPAAADADADPVWVLVWPPTAPAGLADATAPPDPVATPRPGLGRPRETPWTSPTTLTSVGDGWRLEHGATDARPADPPVEHADAASLTADLERIECWPMDVDEYHRHRLDRLFVAVSAQARDEHYQGHVPTEPYASRIRELQRHLRADHLGAEAASTLPTPLAPRPRGDLLARLLLVDADAWASAQRTRQAGGAGWDLDGRARP